jgi:hypothetical protein
MLSQNSALRCSLVVSPHHACKLNPQGVSAVGVAMVASAAKAMAGKLCGGWLRSLICTFAVVLSYYWPKAYTFPVAIAAGGLATLLWSWIKKEPVPQSAVSGGGWVAVGSPRSKGHDMIQNPAPLPHNTPPLPPSRHANPRPTTSPSAATASAACRAPSPSRSGWPCWSR